MGRPSSHHRTEVPREQTLAAARILVIRNHGKGLNGHVHRAATRAHGVSIRTSVQIAAVVLRDQPTAPATTAEGAAAAGSQALSTVVAAAPMVEAAPGAEADGAVEGILATRVRKGFGAVEGPEQGCEKRRS